MTKKYSQIRRIQLNNVMNDKGFSLVELLVAMVILMVVSIPLLHAFVTTAYTNRDAAKLMSATDAAENIMEQFESQDIEELINLYNVGDNVVTIDNTSSPYNMEKYKFVIKNASNLPDDMPDGYYAVVTLDPDLYPNANSLNVADIKSMSADEAAVYTMSDTYDKGVYDQYVTWNTDWYNSNPAAYLQKDETFFKDNLKRNITVSINKIKTETNEFGEDVDICTVNLKVEYELTNYSGILSADKSKYVSSEVELFNNIATMKPLTNIYLLYMPRYNAAINHKGYDKITVQNPGNVEANLFIVAQNSKTDAHLRTQYESSVNGLVLNVVEDVKSGTPSTTKSNLTLFTNLVDGAPYSSNDTTDYHLLCNLKYSSLSGAINYSGDVAKKIMGSRALDGKALVAEDTNIRIYKMITTVYNGDGNEVCVLDGTRLK